MFVKPVAGRLVPDPERGGDLPPDGANVPDNQYWLRRINDGDVVEGTVKTENGPDAGKAKGK